MKTKEELGVLCETFFEKAHPSWHPIKEIVNAIIDEYPGNWGKECSIEVTEETSKMFYSNPEEYLACTKRAISDILSVSVDSVTISGKTFGFKVKE